MDEIICLYKPQGITPLQLIEKFRLENPQYKDEKIGFAGRLDPLAHGVMLLTAGLANKRRQNFLQLNKTYKFSVLCGIETDSYDYLGILKNSQVLDLPKDYKSIIEKFIAKHTGKYIQPYPPFSSKTINGVQLYKLAKRVTIKNQELSIKSKVWPIREVEVFSFRILKEERFLGNELLKTMVFNLKKIRGFFRQTKIIKQWKDFFKINENQEFKIIHFEIECTSGTYVRSLAHNLGKELGVGAIAFEIFRTKVGSFGLEKTLKLHDQG